MHLSHSDLDTLIPSTLVAVWHEELRRVNGSKYKVTELRYDNGWFVACNPEADPMWQPMRRHAVVAAIERCRLKPSVDERPEYVKHGFTREDMERIVSERDHVVSVLKDHDATIKEAENQIARAEELSRPLNNRLDILNAVIHAFDNE